MKNFDVKISENELLVLRNVLARMEKTVTVSDEVDFSKLSKGDQKKYRDEAIRAKNWEAVAKMQSYIDGNSEELYGEKFTTTDVVVTSAASAKTKDEKIAWYRRGDACMRDILPLVMRLAKIDEE